MIPAASATRFVPEKSGKSIKLPPANKRMGSPQQADNPTRRSAELAVE